MRCLHRLFVLSITVTLAAQTVCGAGFALFEGSARGSALVALTARADDPSAIYYNPAGITQMEGVHMLGGALFYMPVADVEVETPMGPVTTSSKDTRWAVPHLYGTWQMNDRVWAGLGLYSRFGLGTEFDEDWPGRFNSYSTELQTLTFNPNIALKLHDKISVAAGVSAMWFDLTMEQKLPVLEDELNVRFTGDSIGYGYNAAVRYEALNWLALGASYQSSVKQDLDGTIDAGIGKSTASGSIKLPDMLFLGAVVKPAANLSVEAGAIYSGWSKYDVEKIEIKDPSLLGTPEIVTEKDWNDVWLYYVGSEYGLTDSWDIRLSYAYVPEAGPERTADYTLLGNDCHTYSVGCGYRAHSWRLDLAYSYVWIKDRSLNARIEEGVLDSEFKNMRVHVVGVSLTKEL